MGSETGKIVLRDVDENDFSRLERALSGQEPDRPVLFEFCINENIARQVLGDEWEKVSELHWTLRQSWAMARLGYDYLITTPTDMGFPKPEREKSRSVSMSGGGVITDRASFDAYPWPDPEQFDCPRLDQAARMLGRRMKLVIFGFGSVLETVVSLMGYEGMCMATVDDPQLLADMFEAVGSRMARGLERCIDHPAIGAFFPTDDWGFKTQPMLPPAMMEELVFPQHKRLVEIAHRAGVPAILHSCGNLESLMDGIVDELGYDGKHSWEDAILPVEEAWDRYGQRVCIVGGLDVDFLCRARPEEIRRRSREMLEKTKGRRYLLGSGNSVPDYVPTENYLAMVQAAVELR